MKLHINLGENGYDILVKRGALKKADEHMNLARRVLIVTDSGVPKEYAETLLSQCKDGVLFVLNQGEDSKCFAMLEKLLSVMLQHDFSRKDCVVAVGGGMVGDISAFAAASYMRGIDFYNVPTTLLSQVDSSIGGKCAVNLCGVKNIVGAFHQPKAVLIDPDLLKTLDKRQFACGLAEVIKMALTSEKELFELLEREELDANLDEVILRALKIKARVVEEDEKEQGVRKILNFGHTIGHGIESTTDLLHGECVALGLLPMCAPKVRERAVALLKKYDLYNLPALNWEKIQDAAFHDKKADGDTVCVTTVEEIGTYKLQSMKTIDVLKLAKDHLKG